MSKSSTMPRTPRGMRDFPPQEKRRRDWVVDRIRSVFERYGYDPIETPAVELFEVLQAKLGDEGEQLLFKILRRGTALDELRLGKVPSVTVESFDEIVDSALRFDLTVPFARFIAMHPDLPRPLKRYQIQPVWRAERQQRGRFREFYQCDVDVAGSSSMMADAEIVAIVVETLQELGFKDFVTHIGHRKILEAIVQSAGGADWLQEIRVAIDKLDKVGLEGVREELAERGVPAQVAGAVLSSTQIEGSPQEILTHLDGRLASTGQGPQGVAETRELFEILGAMGVPANHLMLDLRLVRGLDYYTGPVYESIVTQPAIGSLTGGGRYDELLGKFSGQSIPATGTSVGLERIIEVMKEFSMFPPMTGGTEVLVTIFDESTRAEALALVGELRRGGLRSEITLQRPKGLRKQINYAAGKGIPLLAVVGPDEIASGRVVLRASAEEQWPVDRRDAPREAARILEMLRERRSD